MVVAALAEGVAAAAVVTRQSTEKHNSNNWVGVKNCNIGETILITKIPIMVT